VYEDVLAAVVGGDETPALGHVEPLAASAALLTLGARACAGSCEHKNTNLELVECFHTKHDKNMSVNSTLDGSTESQN
jgi:hypothetical protein